MTANSSQPLADDDFDRPMLLRVTFLEPAQVHLRDSELTLLKLRRLLKTHLFG